MAIAYVRGCTMKTGETITTRLRFATRRIGGKKERWIFSLFFLSFLFPPFGQPQEWPSVTSLFCRLLIIAQLTSYYRGWHAPLIVHHHANTFLSASPSPPPLSLFTLTPPTPPSEVTRPSRAITAFPARGLRGQTRATLAFP